MVFSPNLVKRIKFLHGDRSGENISLQLKNYLNEKSISISYTERQNQNQVTECVNKVIQEIIASRKFDDFDDSIQFSDLLEDLNHVMFKGIVEPYNTISTSSPKFLQGFSKELIDSSKEFIRNFSPEVIDQKFLIL